MSTEPTPTRRPIAAVRISTVALLGIVATVAVPAGATTLVLPGSIDSKTATVDIRQAGPVSKVVITEFDNSVHVTGDPALVGVSGRAVLNWHGFGKNRPVSLDQQYANGVLTLTEVCDSDCGGGGGMTISVPPTVSLQVKTSNAGIFVSNVSGTVDLSDSNASISAEGLGSGDATLHTSNAGIHASFAGAPENITAITSNSDVTIATDGHTPYFDDVKTSNADQNLTNAQDHRSDRTIYVRTSNADVTIK